MRILPFVLLASALTACGALLGSGEDDVPAPARDQDSGPDVDASNETATGDAAVDAVIDSATDATSDAAGAGPVDKFVFVSSATYSGNFGTLADADDLCTFLAKQADAGAFASSKFRAYLASGAGAPAAARVVDQKYMRMDRTVVFNPGPQTNKTPSDLLAMDEKGANLGASGMKFVWTGMAGDAGASTRTCAGWTSSDGTTFGGFGDMHTTAQWADQNGATAGCDSAFRIYCFEE